MRPVSGRRGTYHPTDAAAREQRAALARVAFLGARGRFRDLPAALRRAARLRGPRAVEEVLLQLVLFSGYPTAIEAFRAWRGVRTGRAASATSRGERRDWSRRGAQLCRRVYGPDYPGLRAWMRDLSPELDGLMTEVGYGRVLSRPGLAPPERELVTVAALLGGDRARQLRAHVAGSLRTGVAAEELLDVISKLGRSLPPGARHELRTARAAVRAAAAMGGSE